METQSVFCEVGTEFLSIIWISCIQTRNVFETFVTKSLISLNLCHVIFGWENELKRVKKSMKMYEKWKCNFGDLSLK